jgi:plasmid stability protein
MIRTQIQIDEPTYDALRDRAFKEHRSMASLVRDLLARSVGRGRKAPKKAAVRFRFVGMVRGKQKDVSSRHDDYLAGKKRW